MSKTIKQFDYRIIKMKKRDTLPFNPHVEIVLDHWVEQNNNTPIISPALMSEAEIDVHIQLLIDLDAVGKRAKAALLRTKAETTTIVSNRNSN